MVLFAGLAILMRPVPQARADSHSPAEDRAPDEVWIQAPGNPGTRVEAALVSRLVDGEQPEVMIHFKEKADLSPAYEMDWIARGRFVVETLQETAERSQRGAQRMLKARGVPFHSFWIANVIIVEKTDYATLNQLLAREEIEVVHSIQPMTLIEPAEPQGDEADATPASHGVESNLVQIGVPDVWDQAITGEGIVVGTIDSGARFTHQALVEAYRGNKGEGFDHNYNWWDPYGEYDKPVDKNGHGSHVMGILVGDGGEEARIGVAPGAKWLACRGCDSFSCGNRQLLACAQFMTAPWDLRGGNRNPDLRPHVVNNSWGGCQQLYEPWFQSAVDSWHAAGIYPLFAAGNSSNCRYSSPPGPDTVNNPARYGNVTAVGSSGKDDGQYASHSTWGPTDNADTINPRGYPDVKPQVIAPGVHIRSASNYGDDRYFTLTGTSMSTPHVAGLVALMWEAAPCLRGDYAATETILERSASPISYDTNVGGEGVSNVPNYATGWGEIDAVAAVKLARDACIVVKPAEQSQCNPETVTYEVYVGRSVSSDEPVTLSAAGLPPGATATFSRNPVSAPARSTLTIGDLGSGQAGLHELGISGRSSEAKHTARAKLALHSTAPGRPDLLSPDGQAQGQSLSPSFSWSPVEQAESYEFQLAADSAFETIVHQATGIKGSDYTLPVSLQTGKKYFWRVRARNSCGTGPFSVPQQFVTQQAPGVCPAGTEPTVLYSDDFEGGASGWVPHSVAGNNRWELQSRLASKGTTAWHVPDVDTISDQRLISPEIQLPDRVAQLELRFWQYRNLEAGTDGVCYDAGMLDVATNGNDQWLPVERSGILTDPYNGPVNQRFENPLAQEDRPESWAWCGNPGKWAETVVDLTDHAGESIRFRLRLGTDRSVREEGWYVDDVTVQACLPGTTKTFLPVLQR